MTPSPYPRKPQDKTVRFSLGWASFSSGRGDWTSWQGKTIFRAVGDYAGYYCLLTERDMRALAAELVKRADYERACKAARKADRGTTP